MATKADVERLATQLYEMKLRYGMEMDRVTKLRAQLEAVTAELNKERALFDECAAENANLRRAFKQSQSLARSLREPRPETPTAIRQAIRSGKTVSVQRQLI